MGIKTRAEQKAISKVGKEGIEAINKLNDNMKILEQEMVTVADNQLEFEKYLKDILNRLKEKDEE